MGRCEAGQRWFYIALTLLQLVLFYLKVKSFFFFGIIRDYQSRLESLPTFQLGFSEHTDFFHLNNKGNLVVWLILRMSNGALTRVVFEGQLCCSC